MADAFCLVPAASGEKRRPCARVTRNASGHRQGVKVLGGIYRCPVPPSPHRIRAIRFGDCGEHRAADLADDHFLCGGVDASPGPGKWPACELTLILSMRDVMVI